MKDEARLVLTPDAAPTVGHELGLIATRGDHAVVGQPVVEISPARAADEVQRTVGTTDGAGALRWTPEVAGTVLLEIDGDRVALGVRPGGGWSAGLAGALTLGLLGGALLWTARRMRR